MFGEFSNPSTLFVLIVSKNGQFLNPPTQSSAYVIYEWSLRDLINEQDTLSKQGDFAQEVLSFQKTFSSEEHSDIFH